MRKSLQGRGPKAVRQSRDDEKVKYVNETLESRPNQRSGTAGVIGGSYSLPCCALSALLSAVLCSTTVLNHKCSAHVVGSLTQ